MIEFSGLPAWVLAALAVIVVLLLMTFSRNRNSSSRRRHFSTEYFRGLDYLLNDEQDKALYKHFGIVGPPAIMFFDKDGVLTRAIGKNYTLNALSWVPADPGCSVAPFVSCFDPWAVMPGTNTNSADDNLGGGEHTTAIYREWIYIYDQWFPTWIKYSGLNLHIRIAGYGTIFANAGTLIEQFNFETFEWDVIKMTPNWDNWKEKDVFAMCSYHGNR